MRLALRAAARRGRRRQRARGAAALVLLLATAIGVAARLRHGRSTRQASNDPRPVPSATTSRNPTSPALVSPPVVTVATARRAGPGVVIARIRTDAGLTDRLSIRPDPAGWQRLTDDDLLRRLSDVGKPAGLAYVDGRAILLFHKEPRDRGRMPSRLLPHGRSHAEQ
jgi:hypothetical protein